MGVRLHHYLLRTPKTRELSKNQQIIKSEKTARPLGRAVLAAPSPGCLFGHKYHGTIIEGFDLRVRLNAGDSAKLGKGVVARLPGNGNAHIRMNLERQALQIIGPDRKSTRLNSSHVRISYAVFCLKK